MQIIAFGGNMKAGKDTAANVLCRHYGYVKMALAEPIKQSVKHFFGFSDYQVYDDGKDELDERYGITPREILQYFGTDLAQFELQRVFPSLGKFKREFWVQRLLIEVADKGYDKVVISDLRFPHERNALPVDSVAVHIDRPITRRKVGDSSVSHHLSETEIMNIDFDYYVSNDMSLLEFEEYIRWAMESIFLNHKRNDIP